MEISVAVDNDAIPPTPPPCKKVDEDAGSVLVLVLVLITLLLLMVSRELERLGRAATRNEFGSELSPKLSTARKKSESPSSSSKVLAAVGAVAGAGAGAGLGGERGAGASCRVGRRGDMEVGDAVSSSAARGTGEGAVEERSIAALVGGDVGVRSEKKEEDDEEGLLTTLDAPRLGA